MPFLAKCEYAPADSQDYFEYILKKHGEKAINPPIRIYIGKIENKITFKLKLDVTLNF